ncbi:MAG: AbrB/MazE/SpoVT family DNA-binding domain-containing protein [Candidatus Brocadiales bacterium]|nr:AbrB/MazE/SpoVT family DNA-binding domain-containing protein [Candidatus Bathyanammoxibius sp.]
MGEKTIVEVAKTYAQHGSVVVVIPMLFRTELKLDAGDYVVFRVVRDTGIITLTKFETKGDPCA